MTIGMNFKPRHVMGKKYFGFTFKNQIDESSRRAAAISFMAWHIPAFEVKKYLEKFDNALITIEELDAKLKKSVEDQKKEEDEEEHVEADDGDGVEDDDDDYGVGYNKLFSDYDDDDDGDDYDDDDDDESLFPFLPDSTSTGAVTKEWFLNRSQEWQEVFGEKPSEDDYAYLLSDKRFGCKNLPTNYYALFPREFHSPREMASYVKQYVVGQDEAIDHLSVTFFQHYLDRRNQSKKSVKMPVVLLGSTGTGKSEILRRFSELCDCPVVRINSNDVVPNGWRGATIRDYIAGAMRDGYTQKDMRYAVIVFHEFDKLTHKGMRMVGSNSSDFDMDMMREIMRLFESGHPLRFSSGNPFEREEVELPTENLLILFDGAFHGLEDIIRKRMKHDDHPIGFGRQDKAGQAVDWFRYVEYRDLLEWGFSPELIGRVGELIPLSPLDENLFLRIMREAKDSVFEAHRQFCENNHIELDFSDGAMRLIAQQAQESGMGFRNVKTLLARVLNRVYYDINTNDSRLKRVHIDSSYVARQLGLEKLKH